MPKKLISFNATMAAAPVLAKLSDTDWRTFKELGYYFSEEHRLRIESIINKYNTNIATYRLRPRPSAIKPILGKITELATELSEIISRSEDDSVYDVDSACTLIVCADAILRPSSRLDLFDLRNDLDHLAACANQAVETHCKKSDAGASGDPYLSTLICDLSEILCEAGEKEPASKTGKAFLKYICEKAGVNVLMAEQGFDKRVAKALRNK